MLSTNLVVFKPLLATGRCSATVIASGVVQGVFPHVTSSQRAAGLDTHVKTFWGLTNTDNSPLLDPEAYHDKPTISPDDFVVMWLSAQRTVAADLAAEAAAADLYGTAILAADIAVGAATFDVTVKNADLLPGGIYDIFKDSYEIKICSNSDALASDGVEEIKVISGTPTFSGLVVTITVTVAFVSAFTADGSTRVSSLIRPGDTKTSATAVVKTSASGTIDEGSYPFILDNYGTVEQDWSLDFTDATHFTLTGDTLGAVGSGIKGTDFSPLNPDFARIYLTIEAAMLGGTWLAGDKITWTTHPARVPIGQLRVVPALSASLANNKCTQVYGGEAAS
ncbi:MAG: hypothetical protein ACI8PB_002905 [Desulforhopalus sp.]|jgi:hypothetical protein